MNDPCNGRMDASVVICLMVKMQLLLYDHVRRKTLAGVRLVIGHDYLSMSVSRLRFVTVGISRGCYRGVSKL